MSYMHVAIVTNSVDFYVFVFSLPLRRPGRLPHLFSSLCFNSFYELEVKMLLIKIVR